MKTQPTPQEEPGSSRTGQPCKPTNAFTLIELLVVVIIIAILAALLLPALAKAKETAYKAQCVSNFKQVQLCWQMYADDYRGFLPYNDVDDKAKSWVAGDVGTAAGAVDISDITNGVLYNYNKSPRIYRCPAAKGNNPPTHSGLDASLIVRTISMTPRMGNYTDHDGLTDNAAGVPQCVTNLTGINSPPPSQATVLVDESVVTCDDSFLAIDSFFSAKSSDPEGFQNSPTIRHGGGGVFSYADGHAGLIMFPDFKSEPLPTGGLTKAQWPDWFNLYKTIYPPPYPPPL